MIKILLVLIFIASIYDVKYMIIPNYISLLIILVGLFSWEIHITGLLLAILNLSVCLFLEENYKGGGDIKLIGAVGLVVGFFNIFWIYIISELLVNLFRNEYKKLTGNEITVIPYAPFLMISSLLILI